jgi:hypothetical protein
MRRTAGHLRLSGLSAGAWEMGWLLYGCYNVHTLWCVQSGVM